MLCLRNSILATLVYYDIFDFPLTLFEINKYLVNPERICDGSSHTNSFVWDEEHVRSFVWNSQRVPDSYETNLKRLSGDIFQEAISLGQVMDELENLKGNGIVGSKNGFYFLSGKDDLYELRMDREKIAAQKWKKFLRIAKWFQAVPYLRAILASGSMALGNTNEDSDFDVLLVAKSGRLYTCRLLLCLVASLFGARRTRYEKSAPDKFCFNHYITDGNLNIKHESLYNAQTYANLKPVLVRDKIFSRFYAENIWLNKYVYNFKFAEEFVLRKVSLNFLLSGISKVGEFILNFSLGNKIEKGAKKYQQKRIKNNPATYESGGRVIFNDNELEFHPRSFESFAIDKYNKKLKQLGIVSHIEEKDSGLTT